MATVLGCASIGGLLTNFLCGLSQEFFTKHQDLIIFLTFILRATRTNETNLFFLLPSKKQIFISL